MSVKSFEDATEETLEWLRNLPDLPELRRQVGDITPEERRKLDDVAYAEAEEATDQELLAQWATDLEELDIYHIGLMLALESHVGVDDQDKSPSAEAVEDVTIDFASLVIQGIEFGLTPVSSGLTALNSRHDWQTLEEMYGV